MNMMVGYYFCVLCHWKLRAGHKVTVSCGCVGQTQRQTQVAWVDSEFSGSQSTKQVSERFQRIASVLMALSFDGL